MLYPALQPLLCDESWANWEATLARMTYQPEVMEAFLASHRAWCSRIGAKRAAHDAERAAHAAAAATRGDTLPVSEELGGVNRGRRGAKAAQPFDPEREAQRAAGRLRKDAREAAAAQAAMNAHEGTDAQANETTCMA